MVRCESKNCHSKEIGALARKVSTDLDLIIYMGGKGTQNIIVK